MVWRAAWLKDQGQDYSLGRGAGQVVRVRSLPARHEQWACRVHGGYGYVEEYKVERFMRDAKLTEIGEGTSQIQRLVIGRKMLGLRVE